MNQQQEESLPDKTDSIIIPHQSQHALLYSVDDVPPWHLSCLLGFQVNFLSNFSPLNEVQLSASLPVCTKIFYVCLNLGR
jgi:hypothetical protein